MSAFRIMNSVTNGIKTLDFYIKVGDLLKSLVIILAILIVVYIIYVIIKYYYPRLFLLGHSSNFEVWMNGYCRETIGLMKEFVEKSGNDSLSKVIQKFFQEYKSLSGTNLMQVNTFKPETIPEFYMLFIFYKALNNERNVKELTLLKTFFKFDTIKKYFQDNGVEINESSVQRMKTMHETFKQLRNKVEQETNNAKRKIKEATNSQLKLYLILFKLDLYINQYFTGKVDRDDVVFKDNIMRSYDMRKSGGIGNTIIFKLYMQDYVDFVFKVTIPKIWKNFFKEVKTVSKRFEEKATSKNVTNFIKNIPNRIAGEDFIDLPDPDIEEHFLKAIFKPIFDIAKAFVEMLKVIKAIVKVINNPLKFIRFLFGYIIGVIIYIIYMLIVALGFFIFPVAAFLTIIWYKNLITIIWCIIFAAISTIYIVLWILDFATGGVVLRLLRCENLPDSWFTSPGFSKGNIWQRAFFCSCPCAEGYSPSGGSFLCRRDESFEPAFCPQQVLFKVLQNNIEVLKKKYMHVFTPSYKYFLYRTDDERKDDIAMAFRNQDTFLKQCSESLNQFDHLGQSFCSDIYLDKKKLSPENRLKVLNLCRQTYCNGVDRDFKFCVVESEEEHVFKGNKASSKALQSNLVIIVVIVTLAAGFFASSHLFVSKLETNKKT